MKLANQNDRAVVVMGDEVADVAEASAGRFGPDVMAIYEDWDAFSGWTAGLSHGTGPLVEGALRSPAPRPRQVFAIGVNYRSHAEESGLAVPEVPQRSPSSPPHWPVRSMPSRSSARPRTGRWSWWR